MLGGQWGAWSLQVDPLVVGGAFFVGILVLMLGWVVVQRMLM